MPRTRKPEITIGAACVSLAVSVFLVTARAQQPAVAIDNDDIGGVVTSASGPEAGVWVIAETRDLPVRYINAVWARGYGLVDGPKTTTPPGKIVNLTATVAPNESAAAQYYPAIYWFSM